MPGEFYRGDCLDVMKTLAADSVDLIVTSPPYADARKHTYGGVAPEQYLEWFLPRAAEMKRVLKPTGSFVLNIKEKVVDGERHTYVLELILALRRETGFRWVEEYMWHKKSSVPGYNKWRFRDAWERLLHFTKEREFKMNQDAVQVPIAESTKKRISRLTEKDRQINYSVTGSGFSQNFKALLGKEFVNPTNVLHHAAVTHDTGHSAAFPEWLPEFFIKLFTDEWDVVLDPFCGSGTTYRVADRLRRWPIGIELSHKNVDLGPGQVSMKL